MTHQIIEQSNDILRAALAVVRIERNPATMNALYAAMRRRRLARDIKSKPQSSHWVRLGL